MLTQRASEYKLPLLLGQTDVRKAFDTISHEVLARAMPKRGAHPVLVRAVLADFKDSRLRFQVPGRLGSTESVSMSRGARQGGPIPLFYGCWPWTRSWLPSPRSGLTKARGSVSLGLSGSEVADDVTLLASSRAHLIQMFSDLLEAMGRVGLKLQLSKCSFMSNLCGDRGLDRDITVSGESIKPGPSGIVKILGCLLSMDGSDSADSSARMTKAWQCFWPIRRNVLRRDLDVRLRLKFWVRATEAVALWGCKPASPLTWASVRCKRPSETRE
eukprot:817808-Alexandrium_andersonii.AAC.2